jgi:hypothetical protein
MSQYQENKSITTDAFSTWANCVGGPVTSCLETHFNGDLEAFGTKHFNEKGTFNHGKFYKTHCAGTGLVYQVHLGKKSKDVENQ